MIFIMPNFQNPWVVSIRNSDGDLHCGGVLTSSKSVATAAHCFTSKVTGKKMDDQTIRSYSIVAGTDKPFLYHCKYSYQNHLILEERN